MVRLGQKTPSFVDTGCALAFSLPSPVSDVRSAENRDRLSRLSLRDLKW
jgi:hypothetical protein